MLKTGHTRGRDAIEQKLRQKIYIEHFGGQAGAVLPDQEAEKYGYTAYAASQNIYAPFKSETDWLFAKWAKLRGPGSNAVTELLKIPKVSLLTDRKNSGFTNVICTLACRKSRPFVQGYTWAEQACGSVA